MKSEMTFCAKAWLNESKYFFAQSLAAFGIGQGFKKLRTAETLHLAKDFLDPPPVRDRLLEPLILLLGQGDANGLPFDFACPRITSASGPGSSILNVAFANPPGLGQLSLEPGILLLPGR